MDFVVVSNSEIWSYTMFQSIKGFLPEFEGTYLVGDYDMDYLLGENLQFLFFDSNYLDEYWDRIKETKLIKVRELVCIDFDSEIENKFSHITFITRHTTIKEIKKLLKGVYNNPNKKYNLTDRDVSILYLLKRGASNKEIGEKLYLSEKTIKNNLTRIFKVLGVSNRYEAMLKINTIEKI